MKKLILLHGALGCKEMLHPLMEALNENYDCYTMSFSGHGQKAFNEEGFGIEYFAEELEEFILENSLEGATVFGYSMGGYVALYLASLKPSLLGKIVTLGTKMAWSPETAEYEVSRLNPELMEEKIPAYTNLLEQRHGEEWKKLVWQTAGMMVELGEAPLLTTETLAQIQNPILIMRGELDPMVNDVESKWAVAQLHNGQYLELENTPHPLEKVDVKTLSTLLIEYFA